MNNSTLLPNGPYYGSFGGAFVTETLVPAVRELEQAYTQAAPDPDFKDKLDETNVYATLGEIVCGQKPGRETDHQTILYTHMGMGSLDVAVGHRMMEKAIAQGKGQRLRLI